MACLDHKYEPGAFGVCRRCGGESPQAEAKRAATKAHAEKIRLALRLRGLEQ